MASHGTCIASTACSARKERTGAKTFQMYHFGAPWSAILYTMQHAYCFLRCPLGSWHFSFFVATEQCWNKTCWKPLVGLISLSQLIEIRWFPHAPHHLRPCSPSPACASVCCWRKSIGIISSPFHSRPGSMVTDWRGDLGWDMEKSWHHGVKTGCTQRFTDFINPRRSTISSASGELGRLDMAGATLRLKQSEKLNPWHGNQHERFKQNGFPRYRKTTKSPKLTVLTTEFQEIFGFFVSKFEGTWCHSSHLERNVAKRCQNGPVAAVHKGSGSKPLAQQDLQFETEPFFTEFGNCEPCASLCDRSFQPSLPAKLAGKSHGVAESSKNPQLEAAGGNVE